MQSQTESFALTADDLAAIARKHGLLTANSPLSPELLAFTLDIVERCAIIGEGYGDADSNAGDDIRAHMGNV